MPSFLPFRYDEAGATITAKWQLGVRNLLPPLAVLPFALVFVLGLLQFLKISPLPPLSILPMHYVMFALYLLILLYFESKVRAQAASLRRGSFSVSFDGDCVTVRTEGDVQHVMRNEDITRVDCGERIVRMASKFGAHCVPRVLVPEALLQSLRDNNNIQWNEPRWM